jgi:hypothetical protein
MDGSTPFTALALAAAFAVIAAETILAIRRQHQTEHQADLDWAAHRTTRYQAARRAENLRTLQYHAGPDSPAARLAEHGWLQATYAAPSADPGPIRHRNRSLR